MEAEPKPGGSSDSKNESDESKRELKTWMSDSESSAEEGVPPAPHPSPEPEPQPEDQPGGYTTCIDRPYVQKEIRWALQYKKPIITVVEADSHRPGHFDFEKARSKYDVECTCGQNDEIGHEKNCRREWKFLLDISAIDFERNGYKEDGMVRHILDVAERHIVDELPPEGDRKTCPAHRVGALNSPGWWHFFLSHNQKLGGDQMRTLSFLLEKAPSGEKTSWYDYRMTDKSERAMEEGVKHSDAFVLFLTGEKRDPGPRLELKLRCDMPADSAAREEFVVKFTQAVGKVVALADYTLDSWLTENKFAQYAAAIKAADYTELQYLYHATEAHISRLATTVGMPPPVATSFGRCCAELRELPLRIQVVQLREGSVIVAFDVLPVDEQSVAAQHTTVGVVATLKRLVRRQSELSTETDSTIDGATDGGTPTGVGASPSGPRQDRPHRGSQAADDLLSLLDPDHELIVHTSPAYMHELARANPRWIDDEECGMNCMLCSELFFSIGRGLTDKTRHHCRYCGWVVCGRCCPDKQLVELDRWTSSTLGHPIKRAKVPRLKRVCNVCFEIAPREVQARTELDLQVAPPRGYAWVKQTTGPFSTWPERFIELAYASGTTKAVMGLHVYNSDYKHILEESIDDLRGKTVERGTEKWPLRGSYAKLTISNEFGAADTVESEQATSSEERIFVFADEICRDRFADACSNLATGRIWNTTEAGIALVGGEADTVAGVDLRQQLVDIYTRHNPRKVADIDQLMVEWAGQPGGVAAMIPKIRDKYLRPPSPLPDSKPHEGTVATDSTTVQSETSIPGNSLTAFSSDGEQQQTIDLDLEPEPEPEPEPELPN